MERIITVFGSARAIEGMPEYQMAYALGKELATKGFVVCNGGFGGTMEASARGAKEAGGRTIGVTFHNPPRTPNPWIDEHYELPTLIDRLLKLIEFGNAYVVLKGGTGTLLELSAVWEFMNKKIIQEKPIITVSDFWHGVVDTLKNELLWEGMGDCTHYIHRTKTPKECAEFLADYFYIE
ncbi:MAG TPA: LOG family protein [Bacteroidota bacterium]|nr:LOG family protein [Bacteroidota bacterium]